jgi:hypothetical protein
MAWNTRDLTEMVIGPNVRLFRLFFWDGLFFLPIDEDSEWFVSRLKCVLFPSEILLSANQSKLFDSPIAIGDLDSSPASVRV